MNHIGNSNYVFKVWKLDNVIFHTVQVQQMGLTLSANIYSDQIGIQQLLLYICTANWVISIKQICEENFLKFWLYLMIWFQNEMENQMQQMSNFGQW